MKLLLIDGHYYVYRSFFALPALNNSKGEPTNAILGFAKTVRRMLTFVQTPKDEADGLVELTTVIQEVVRLAWRRLTGQALAEPGKRTGVGAQHAAPRQTAAASA